MSIFGGDLTPGTYMASHGHLILRNVRSSTDGYSIYVDYSYDGRDYVNFHTTRSTNWNMHRIEFVIEEMGPP